MNSFVRILGFFILCFVFQSSGMANTIIRGVVKNGDQRPVRISVYSDYLTMEEEEKTHVVPQEDGTFSARFFIPETEYVIISVGFKETYIYISPGDTMEVRINYDNQMEHPGGFMPLRQPLDLWITYEKDSSVNQLTFEFDSLFALYFPENTVKNIVFNNDIRLYDSLQNVMSGWVEQVNRPFISQYARYFLAQMESLLYTQRMRSLGEKHIAREKILYRHMEYMRFFENFVQSYVPLRSVNISPAALDQAVGIEVSYRDFDNLLGRDTIFRNEQVRELAMIALLKSFYTTGKFDSETLLSLMEQVARRTKFNGHHQMARRFVERWKRQQSHQAPDFSFPVPGKDSVRISDFQGRYLVINFFQGNNLPSMIEMDVMERLYEEKTNDVYLLSISMDDDYSDFRGYLRRNTHPWDVVHFDGQYEVARHYNILSVPRFVLVGPDGKVVRDYFPKLSAGGLEQLYQMLDKRR